MAHTYQNASRRTCTTNVYAHAGARLWVAVSVAACIYANGCVGVWVLRLLWLRVVVCSCASKRVAASGCVSMHVDA